MNQEYLAKRQINRNHLWLLWSAALILRIVYLLLAITEYGFEKLVNYAADTRLYVSIADYFVTGHISNENALLLAGPGYGLMLAALRVIFGESMLWPILLNVFLGSLAPIVIYLLAFNLVRSRAVATVAGMISCLSFTSITLSNQILTDQAFFTIHATALLLFAIGFNSGRRRWFLLAGLVAGAAALIRTSGEFWPLLFLFVALIIPAQPAFASRRQMIQRAAITSIVMLLIINAWSFRNYVVHDVYAFSTNGVLSIRNYMLNEAVCRHTPGCKWADQGLAWVIEDGDRSLPVAESFANAKARIVRTIAQHPDWVASTYLDLVDGNIRTINHIMKFQIPSLKSFTIGFYEHMDVWLGYLLVVVSVAGVIVLLKRRNFLAASLLGITYLYFTLLVGFSFNQGSRLHYPAEMAWAILVAYVIVTAARYARKLLSSLRANRKQKESAVQHDSIDMHKVSARFRWLWGSTFVLILIGGCSSEKPALSRAVLWTEAHAEPQSILELSSRQLTNTNVDLGAAIRLTRPFDTDSIEMTVHEGKRYYHPVAMAHRCFHFLGAYLKTSDSSFLQRAETYFRKLKSTAVYVDSAAFIPYPFDYRVHKLDELEIKAPWYSAMSQGELLSISTRLYEFTVNEEYREFADQLFYSLLATDGLAEPWVTRIDTAGYLWLEEYPLETGPDQTLNGFIAAVYGVYDYWRMTKSVAAKHMYDACLTTLKRYIPDFRRPGQLSYYCLGHHHVTDDEYHLLHISMCRELFRLSGDSTFLRAADAFAEDSLPKS